MDTKRASLHRALKRGVHLIKPNVHELEELAGEEMTDDAHVERAARQLISSGGAEVVVVSWGAAGSLW